jgi:polar amino acid transport system substrate-binding protein
MRVTNLGNVSGLDVDSLRSISEISRCKFEYVIVSRARALAMYESGEVDILTSAFQTPERDLHGRFLPFLEVVPSLITLRGAFANPMDALQNGKITLNIVQGYDYGVQYKTLLLDLSKRGLVETVADPIAAIKKLIAKRGDGVLMPASAAAIISKELEPNRNEFTVTLMKGWDRQLVGTYFSNYIIESDLKQILSAAKNKKIIDDTWIKLTTLTPAWGLIGLNRLEPKN